MSSVYGREVSKVKFMNFALSVLLEREKEREAEKRAECSEEKEMKSNSKLWPFIRQNQLLVKLLIAVLLMGLVVKLFSLGSQQVETQFVDKAVGSNRNEDSDANKCDLFNGDWIPNRSGPIYSYQSCPFIEEYQNCQKYGRHDIGFLYWRWNPRACDLPQFDPRKFLDSMRNKTWAFIGDSLSRNHVQSFLCLLSTVEQAIVIYGDDVPKFSKTWHFSSYNITVSYIWSVYLVESVISFDENGLPIPGDKVQLDKLQKNWTDAYKKSDYVIISTGSWFTRCAIYYVNNKLVGCYNCPTMNLTQLGLDFGFGKALRLVMNFIATSNHKGMIFYRTSSPDHYENGEWHNGGSCPKKKPLKEGEIELKGVNKTLHDFQLEEFEEGAIKANENGVKLKLLDFTNLLLLRPDGHPGRYHPPVKMDEGNNAIVRSDCLHWCLPGPIDAVNDILMEMVVNG